MRLHIRRRLKIGARVAARGSTNGAKVVFKGSVTALASRNLAT